MATRPRTSSTRTKKTAPPPGGVTPQETAPQVTRSTLERRELPSFSSSREERIAEAAYWRAERRGFASGHELDDWLEAEKEIDNQKRDVGQRDPGE